MANLDNLNDSQRHRHPPEYGYLPTAELGDLLSQPGRFTRAVSVAGRVDQLYDGKRECRYVDRTDLQLPAGIYWFDSGDDGGIVLQVPPGSGISPAASTVCPAPSLEEDHPLSLAKAWAEHLWHEGTAIPAPRFSADDRAISKSHDADVTIIERQFLRTWMYKIKFDGKRYSVSESALEVPPNSDEPSEWVKHSPAPAARFGATLTRAKLTDGFANTLFSFRSTRTSFRPYQFKPVLKMLKTGRARILIADEVGLGKTIEAGLLWTELAARREADRVLIVCPSSLVEKWTAEMRERFGFELVHLDTRALNDFVEAHRENRLPSSFAFVGSLESLRTWGALDELRESPPELDLVIVDEAHTMRNRDTKSYALGSELSDWATSLVFLTATPINLRQDDLLALLELISPEDAGDLSDLMLRLEPNRILNSIMSQIRQKEAQGPALARQLEGLDRLVHGRPLTRRTEYEALLRILESEIINPAKVIEARSLLAELNTLSTIITRTKKVEVDDRKSTRSEIRVEVSWADAERRFYELYVDWCDERARVAGTPLHFAMQMPLRLASACLPMARSAVLGADKFDEYSRTEGDTAVPALPPSAELYNAALRLPADLDTKFEALSRTFRRINLRERRCLLFTHSRKALRYLEERISKEYRVATLHGGVSPERRLEIMSQFRAGAFDLVLANRVASEGLDFEFCSAVINYDLPWNPMEIEQRIGRIDRIGQAEEKILIANFVNYQTIDDRIMIRLLDRIKIFESTVGPLEPIISETSPQIMQAAFDFSLTDSEREQRIFEVLTALEQQQAGLKELSDSSTDLLVSDDVDVDGLEDELLGSGRYLGQYELSFLIHDWAITDGAEGITFQNEKNSATVIGNTRMAARLDEAAGSGAVRRDEARTLSTKLRHEEPISVALDQEFARTRGLNPLSASHPLVAAAASLPNHREARFSSVAVPATPSCSEGSYLVLLARATTTGAHQSSEIWGAAVPASGHAAISEPVDALLAALAEGTLSDHVSLDVSDMLLRLETAEDALLERQGLDQSRRQQNFSSQTEARLASLKAQFDRRASAIELRIETAKSRRRDPRIVSLFESQLRRAEARFAQTTNELRSQPAPIVMLENLAVCSLTIISSGKE